MKLNSSMLFRFPVEVVSDRRPLALSWFSKFVVTTSTSQTDFWPRIEAHSKKTTHLFYLVFGHYCVLVPAFTCIRSYTFFTLYSAASLGLQCKWKKRSERRKHCALPVVRRSQKFSPRRTPLPGNAGPPKFNQLEMVTTFTYKPSLVKIDTRNFELSW